MQNIKIYFTAMLLFVLTNIAAQTKKISLSLQDVPLKEAFTQVQQKSGCRILFNDEIVPDGLKVSASIKDEDVTSALTTLLKNTELAAVPHDNLIIVTNKKFLEQHSQLFGTVSDESNAPLEFANVALVNPNDSDKIKYSAITDLKGNFEMIDVKNGTYKMVVSYVGYKTIHENITVADSKKLSYQLSPDEKTLKTVNVQGSSIRFSANKATYQILKADMAGKRDAMDLVEKIPQITIDRMNEKIKSTNNKPIKLLLNGINATEIDLKSIRPENVMRLEYFDIPPARYAEYGSVINIITKVPQDGWAGGANINHAFTTGFGNDMVYLKYNTGRHQFAIDYSLYHRDYDRQEQSILYDYTFKNTHYTRTAAINNAFGYEDNYVNLTYSNQKADNYAFQVKFSPNYRYVHQDGKSDITYITHQIDTVLRTGTNKLREHIFNPSTDIYFSKQLPQKQEIAVNVVGTAFSTSNKYNNREFVKDSVALNDKMDEKNRKYSLIAEMNYSKEIPLGKFNTGYSLETNKMKTDITNSFGISDYNTSFTQHYIYSEFSGEKNKWQYMASLGLYYRSRKNYDNQYSGWIFRPRFVVGYAFNSANNWKFGFERTNQEPSLADLSNNKIYVTDQIIKQGNPLLRNSIKNSWYVVYNLNCKYFNMELDPYYNYTQKPQNSYFVEKTDNIVMASENGINSKDYGITYSGVIQPLGNNTLQVRFYGELYNTELNSSQAGYYQYFSKPLFYQISLNIKDFSCYYQGKIVGYSLSGPYLTANENASHVGFTYKMNNWSVSGNVWWLGTLSKYHTYTIPESIVKYERYSKIHDNASMVVIGFSYNFNKGKKYNESQKKLQNSDRDAGVF